VQARRGDADARHARLFVDRRVDQRQDPVQRGDDPPLAGGEKRIVVTVARHANAQPTAVSRQIPEFHPRPRMLR
jgi:hypothetical protein